MSQQSNIPRPNRFSRPEHFPRPAHFARCGRFPRSEHLLRTERFPHFTVIAALGLMLTLPGIATAQLEGMIDAHVHAAPDSIARSIDAFETARMARRHEMRAMLFKNHYTETASLAYSVMQIVPGLEAFGGIALNRSVGGINPAAVERMAMMAGRRGRVVWLPTFDSEHGHLTVAPNPNYVPVTQDGALLPAVHAMLDIIAAHDLTLATGHSSPAESLAVIRAARERGIERIVVTHPSASLVNMSVEQQIAAARLGALLEYPLAHAEPIGEIPFDEFVAQIRTVGTENIVLTSDLGQVGNPVHTDGFIAFLPRLTEAGFTDRDIDLMTRRNPARLLGLD